MESNVIVYETCHNLRAIGRRALENQWQNAVLGSLLYLALMMVPVFCVEFIFDPTGMMYTSYDDQIYYAMQTGNLPQGYTLTLIVNLYTLLVSGPLVLGYITFMTSIFRRKPAKVSDVFGGFERFGQAFGLYFMMSLFIFLWSLLLIIPGIIAAYRYQMAFYVLMDRPELGVMGSLAESKRLMRGNKWKFFCLQLSFIGWAILASIPFGIGWLWLLPYVQTSSIAFYEIVNRNLVIRHQPDPGFIGQQPPYGQNLGQGPGQGYGGQQPPYSQGPGGRPEEGARDAAPYDLEKHAAERYVPDDNQGAPSQGDDQTPLTSQSAEQTTEGRPAEQTQEGPKESEDEKNY